AGKTSGSTGVSLQFVVDEDSQQWKRAAALCYDQWTGWQLGERVGAIWGNPKTRHGWRRMLRNQLLERFIYLDTLKMDEAAMLRFYREIRRLQPTLLFGHAHSLYLFARYLRRLELEDIRPRGTISTAMVLHDFERREIEEVFGCAVTNRYGCEEVSLIACECREHRGLHLNLDTLVVEFIRDGQPAAAGEPGAIVVTDLSNYGMPFIRYQVGDVGIPSPRSCSCGCSYPLMETIEGRTADYVVTAAGDYISGISLTENFAMCLTGVKQMQIIQERLDQLLLRLVAEPEASRDDIVRQVAALVRQRFGHGMRHEIAFVPEIAQEKSGKYRFCISKVANPFAGNDLSLERERICL
ncbi:MAG: phenylacetate--CoA ligase family protein, partial [Desulfuromonadales bacterium]|nr:phenylacetate--CoA ligase family protein [Desulfuromonadales bacterium]